MKNLHYGKFLSMTSYPFCDVVVRFNNAFPPNGNTDLDACSCTTCYQKSTNE